MADLAPADVCDYACEDADVTFRLYPLLKKELEENGLLELFYDMEMPLMPVLAKMERNGVCLDTEVLAATGRHFTERMHLLEQEIYKLAGHPFTITSPRQVGRCFLKN